MYYDEATIRLPRDSSRGRATSDACRQFLASPGTPASMRRRFRSERPRSPTLAEAGCPLAIVETRGPEPLSAGERAETKAPIDAQSDAARGCAETLEDRLYRQIGNELDERKVDKGVWTKAYGEAMGDDAKTRALYIRQRFHKLLAAETARSEAEARSGVNEEQKIQRLVSVAENRARMSRLLTYRRSSGHRSVCS